MAGGVGSRFWPLSTPEYPKQFIDILGCGRTLIQLTVDRFKGICPMQNFWVVTNAKYVEIVKQQLPDIPVEHILAEPAARNTAPCIAWACWSIKKEDENANVVVTPADAVVMNPEEFRRVISNALSFTEKNNAIVTIGIKPSRPETGYGYVEAKEAVEGVICAVKAFKEKPDHETAEKYLKAGNYLWNAGIFVWNIETITTCIQKYKPQIASQMDVIVNAELTTGSKLKEVFPQCEKISIDYAVMEPASADNLVYTHPADFGWSDLGTWGSLYDLSEKDTDGNVTLKCHTQLYDSKNNIVVLPSGKLAVVAGMDGYLIAESDNVLLICKKGDSSALVRKYVNEVQIKYGDEFV